MAKVNVNDITIWTNGEIKVANVFSCMCLYDNLIDEANFYIELLDIDEKIVLFQGNQTINLENYINWKNQGFTTEWLINFLCNKLNLTIKNINKNGTIKSN